MKKKGENNVEIDDSKSIVGKVLCYTAYGVLIGGTLLSGLITILLFLKLQELVFMIVIAYIIGLALLMISLFKYPSYKKSKKALKIYGIIGLAFVMLFLCVIIALNIVDIAIEMFYSCGDCIDDCRGMG